MNILYIKYLRQLIFVFLLVLSSLPVLSQVPATGYMNGTGINRDPFNTGKTEEQMRAEQEADTLSRKKKERIVKPMLSYLFTDSIKKTNVFSWVYSPKNNSVKLIPIDTMLSDFQRDYIFFQNQSVGNAYLGNLGGAVEPLNYFDRSHRQYFSFLDAYNPYIFTPENVPFFNGKKPFTQLSFFMSGQTRRAEEQLRVLHSQNISPSTSFNLNYRNNGTKGMYNFQRSKDKNLSLAVTHTGKRLTIHGGYIYNMGNIQENGGLFNDGEVLDTLIDLPQNLTMNMKDAYNKFKGNTFYATASYAIPFAATDSLETIANVPAMFIGTSVEYTKYRKAYSDTKSEMEDASYYKNWYINPDRSLDSIAERSLDIKAFVQLQPYSREGVLSTVDGGVGLRNERYYNFKLSDYLSPQKGEQKTDFYVYANIGGKLKKYLNWKGAFDYTPIGYRSQDLKINGELDFSAYIRNKPLTLSGSVEYRIAEPSFWSQHYFSNHYVWNNSFKKENETRFSVKLLIPDFGVEAGLTQSVITNKVYYNSESMPTQYSDALSVTGVFIRKDFRIIGFHFNNRVLLQWSSNKSVVPVPMASVNLTYFYEFNVVKNVLRLQIGADGYFNTKYYGFGYNPAIMQFYNQNEVQVGNYPVVDLFISGKWKRLRFLVKMQHFNYELFGGRNYMSVAHYPLNRRMFKLGISWNFYD